MLASSSGGSDAQVVDCCPARASRRRRRSRSWSIWRSYVGVQPKGCPQMRSGGAALVHLELCRCSAHECGQVARTKSCQLPLASVLNR